MIPIIITIKITIMVIIVIILTNIKTTTPAQTTTTIIEITTSACKDSYDQDCKNNNQNKILTKENRNIRVTVIITTVEVIYIQHDTQIKRYNLGTDTYINI